MLRSSGAATLSQVWRVGVTLVTQAFLRRLVPEADWGAWHWAVDLLFLLLAQVRDLGLPAHLVRDPERPYGSFLRVELLWGGVLAVVLFVAAPWIARAGPAGSPYLVPVLWGLLIFFLVEGLGKVPLTYFEAEIRVDRALVPELARNIVFAVVAVVLAWGWQLGIYAMLVAHVSAAVVFTALLWRRARADGMPLEDATGGTWQLIRRSLHLMPMALVILALDVADYQIMPAFFPFITSSELGIYGAALTLALMTTRVLEYPLRRALYPAFVAVRHDTARFFEVYRMATVFLMSIHILAAGMLTTNATLVLTIYGSGRYIAAVPYLQLLCLMPLVQPFTRCAEDVLLPRHEENVLTAAYVINLIVLVVSSIFLIHALGPRGMAVAKLLPLGALLVTWAVARVDFRRFGRLAADLLLLYAVGFAAFAAGDRLAGLLDGTHLWARLAVTGTAGTLAAAVFVAVYGRSLRDLFRHQLGERPNAVP